LIGIGKHFIPKIKAATLEIELINAGMDYFCNKHDKKLKINDILEIEHYERIMGSFANGDLNKIKKRVIVKDATASINQIFMKKLGPLNQEALNYVNLGAENI
jgi:2-hydroxy-3-keto-5-methylthiopentenyl-1-phosphate phosphatase